MTVKKVLITGANGQLGSAFRALPDLSRYSCVFTTNAELDIANPAQLSQFLDDSFDFCINCAAYTAVDKAEDEQLLAQKVNAIAVGELARECFTHNITLIHFSTDYVFDGKASIPYSEDHTTDPVNYYGQTKLEGEQRAMQENPSTVIIRSSWLYSEYGHNFVKTMIRLMNEKDRIGVVNDQLGSPTYAGDLVHAVMKIITNNDQPAPGIYHYCNKGIISWYDFANAIKEYTGSNCDVNPLSTYAYPTRAKRPAYSAFNTNKFENTFKVIIPEWKDSLWKCMGNMR